MKIEIFTKCLNTTDTENISRKDFFMSLVWSNNNKDLIRELYPQRFNLTVTLNNIGTFTPDSVAVMLEKFEGGSWSEVKAIRFLDVNSPTFSEIIGNEPHNIPEQNSLKLRAKIAHQGRTYYSNEINYLKLETPSFRFSGGIKTEGVNHNAYKQIVDTSICSENNISVPIIAKFQLINEVVLTEEQISTVKNKKYIVRLADVTQGRRVVLTQNIQNQPTETEGRRYIFIFNSTIDSLQHTANNLFQFEVEEADQNILLKSEIFNINFISLHIGKSLNILDRNNAVINGKQLEEDNITIVSNPSVQGIINKADLKPIVYSLRKNINDADWVFVDSKTLYLDTIEPVSFNYLVTDEGKNAFKVDILDNKGCTFDLGEAYVTKAVAVPPPPVLQECKIAYGLKIEGHEETSISLPSGGTINVGIIKNDISDLESQDNQGVTVTHYIGESLQNTYQNQKSGYSYVVNGAGVHRFELAVQGVLDNTPQGCSSFMQDIIAGKQVVTITIASNITSPPQEGQKSCEYCYDGSYHSDKPIADSANGLTVIFKRKDRENWCKIFKAGSVQQFHDSNIFRCNSHSSLSIDDDMETIIVSENSVSVMDMISINNTQSYLKTLDVSGLRNLKTLYLNTIPNLASLIVSDEVYNKIQNSSIRVMNSNNRSFLPNIILLAEGVSQDIIKRQVS